MHHQHGVCRFCKMAHIEDGSFPEEAITLEFDDGILAFATPGITPSLKICRIKEGKAQAAKLGGKAWAKTKATQSVPLLTLRLIF